MSRDEPLVPLSQVPTAFPWLPRLRRGKPVSVATVYRWALRGANGRRLATVRCGGALCTTQSRIRRFVEGEPPPTGQEPSAADPDRVDQYLDRLGL